jgi:hypothetical protein
MKKIFTGIIVLFCFISYAQIEPQSKSTLVDIAAIKTELKQNAISLGLKYMRSMDSMFKVQDILMAQKNSLFQLTPQFNVQTGTQDAFSSITAKLTGIFVTFKDTSIGGIITPNSSRGFQTFPFSAGLETNNKFNIINGVLEAGWVPWYQTEMNRRTPEVLKHTRFGIFLQGGYKFSVDTTGKTSAGGEVDQSSEKPDKALFRAKGSLAIDTKSILKMSGVSVGLVGNADAWYDMMNKQTYYSVQAKIRFYLSEHKDKYYDLKYQKGSGAPNFNKGDQFGIGLTMMF